jgi:hypothetical protein
MSMVVVNIPPPQLAPTPTPTPARDSDLVLPTRKASVAARKRKAHTKSRRGCINCKLFHVKCDETQPHCKRCLRSALDCEYPDSSTKKSPLSSAAPTHRYEQTIDLSSPDPDSDPNSQPLVPSVSLSPSPPPSNLGIIIPLHGGSRYNLSDRDDTFLHRFCVTTCFTITPKRLLTANVSRMTYEAGCRNPAIVHAYLALAHLQHHPASSPQQLAFHYYNAAALLREHVSRPSIALADAEVVWALSVLLPYATFAITDPRLTPGARFGPRNLWPCDRTNHASLGWISMLSGRMALLRRLQSEHGDRATFLAIDCAREAQIRFAGNRIPTRDLVAKLSAVLTRPAISALLVLAGYPSDDAPQDEWKRNPYSVPLTRLANSVIMPPSPTQINEYFNLPRWIYENMREQLFARDPLLVLILALLFARSAAEDVWWLRKRVPLQLESMCLYLEEEGRLQLGILPDAMDVLLAYPRHALVSSRPGSRQNEPTITDLGGAYEDPQ